MVSEAAQQVLDLLASDAPFEQKYARIKEALQDLAVIIPLVKQEGFNAWLRNNFDQIDSIYQRERKQP